MNIKVIILFITIVATVITRVDSFFSERFASDASNACNIEITRSRTHQSSHSDKTFYLLSDNHANSVITGNIKYSKTWKNFDTLNVIKII